MSNLVFIEQLLSSHTKFSTSQQIRKCVTKRLFKKKLIKNIKIRKQVIHLILYSSELRRLIWGTISFSNLYIQLKGNMCFLENTKVLNMKFEIDVQIELLIET